MIADAALKGRSSTIVPSVHSEAELIFQGDDGLAVAAEGGDMLQVAVGFGQGFDGAVAEDGVAAGGEIPASAVGVVCELAYGTAFGLRRLYNRET